jgi:hypothetical protein
MKIIPKPVTSVLRPEKPALKPLTTKPTSKDRAYQHLVTSHGVTPDRAKDLLYPPEK